MKLTAHVSTASRLILAAVTLAVLSPVSTSAQEWVQPERSKANVDALARVQVKNYKFEAAGKNDMSYGLYVPTRYNAARAILKDVAGG